MYLDVVHYLVQEKTEVSQISLAVPFCQRWVRR